MSVINRFRGHELPSFPLLKFRHLVQMLGDLEEQAF